MTAVAELLSRLDRVSGRNGRWRARCPAHESRGRTLAIGEADDGRPLIHCHAGCGAGAVLAAVGLSWRDVLGKPISGPPYGPQARRQLMQRVSSANNGKRALAARLWRSATPLGGCAVEYLHGRGCEIPPAEGDLRYLPSLRLYGLSGPALVGRVTDAKTCQALGLHLTWLAQDGERWRRTTRRYVGYKGGGVVRLWPDDAVNTGLSIAEGIETALAAARLRTPIWACLDAGNLAPSQCCPELKR
ncbi:MAG: hypothetical protein R3E83_18465 [Burkholderiaceae bacterium]